MSDLIDRQAAIDALCKVGCGSGHCGISCDDVKAIEQLPSAQPETQKATWALHTYMPHNYYCTHCKKDSPYNKTWSYCPNCGFEMEGYV